MSLPVRLECGLSSQLIPEGSQHWPLCSVPLIWPFPSSDLPMNTASYLAESQLAEEACPLRQQVLVLLPHKVLLLKVHRTFIDANSRARASSQIVIVCDCICCASSISPSGLWVGVFFLSFLPSLCLCFKFELHLDIFNFSALSPVFVLQKEQKTYRLNSIEKETIFSTEETPPNTYEVLVK